MDRAGNEAPTLVAFAIHLLKLIFDYRNNTDAAHIRAFHNTRSIKNQDV